MVRMFAFLTVFAALLGAAPLFLPVAKTAVRLLDARDDPAAIADLGLANLDAATVEQNIAGALVDNDIALATSFLALADARGLAVAPDLRAKVEAANSATASALRSAREFGEGFITGQPSDVAGLAGAVAGDLMVWGDIRDATREGYKLAMGQDADELLLGLSAVGLAVTAGSYATVGLGLPARAGITLVKVAKRTGRLSASLGRTLMRSVREAVDFTALRRIGGNLSAVDGAALKGVVRTDRVKGLATMLGEIGTVQAKAGTRAALEGMRVADSAGDVRRLSRLAEVKGGQTLAILKTLGRGAFVITGALMKLIWWVFVACAYVYALVSSFNAACVAMVRPLWRRKGRAKGRRLDFAGSSRRFRPVGRTARRAP